MLLQIAFSIFRDPKVPASAIEDVVNRQFVVIFGPFGASIQGDVTEMSPADGAYDEDREQYSADSLLDQCVRRMPPHASKDRKYFLYFLSDDMYHGDLNFVFGTASHGRGAVISLYRLDGDKDLLSKLTTHETGHVFALNHCKGKQCVMQFSNSLQELQQKGKEFCGDCQKKLLRKVTSA